MYSPSRSPLPPPSPPDPSRSSQCTRSEHLSHASNPLLKVPHGNMCVLSHFSHVRPCGPSPARLLYPWDSPGKNTGVGWHFLLQMYLIIHNLPSILHPCAFLPFPSEQLRCHIVAHEVLHSGGSAPTPASSCSPLILVHSVPMTPGFFSVLLMCPIILLATGLLHMLFHRMFSSFPIPVYLIVHFKAPLGFSSVFFFWDTLSEPLYHPACFFKRVF